MKYVDGFLLSIPKKKLAEYAKMSKNAGKIWKKHGAINYVETVIDDTKAKGMVSFPTLSNIKKGELVVFSYITYKSRAHRDKVNAKVMKDPVMLAFMKDTSMPFDCSRMAYGGFKSIVDL